jgi:hypothetical protein
VFFKHQSTACSTLLFRLRLQRGERFLLDCLVAS